MYQPWKMWQRLIKRFRSWQGQQLAQCITCFSTILIMNPTIRVTVKTHLEAV